MSSNTSENYIHFRHFDVDKDLPRLVQLMAEIEQVDHTGEDISEETLKAQLSLPGHDPSQDRWVAATVNNDDRIIGFGSVGNVPQNNYADMFVAVHPSWRRQGIGSELLQRTLTQAQTHHPQNILVYADVQHPYAKEFLLKRAFSPVAFYTAMKLASTVALPQPVLPTGYSFHQYNPPSDFPLLLEMYNRAFQGLWGHYDYVTSEVMNNILANETNPEDNFLLFAQNGDVVGTCRGEISEYMSERRGVRTGYLDAPGVVPEHRSKNLYLPLVLHIANWVRTQELIDIEMESWGDDPQVLAQYQQVGFEIIHQQAIYRWQGK